MSITGGQGVNVVPDLVARLRWSRREGQHLQTAVVLRQIRGESTLLPGEVLGTFAWGGSVSGVLPFRVGKLEDRFLFQVNGGKGNARYINDLNSLGGQDAVLDPVTGRIDALYGADTFSRQVMQKRLPKAVYRSLLRTIDHGEPLDPKIADIVAAAMKGAVAAARKSP